MCSHDRTVRFGMVNALGDAVIETECADCGRTLDTTVGDR